MTTQTTETIFGIAMDDIVIWSYFLLGGLFLFYAVITFIQRNVYNTLRLSLSGLFCVIGFLFMNLAGKMITGHTYQFTIMTLINSFVLAVIGLVCVYVVYQRGKIKK